MKVAKKIVHWLLVGGNRMIMWLLILIFDSVPGCDGHTCLPMSDKVAF